MAFFEWRNKSVLVTGGAGFIGSHLTAALGQRHAKVRVLDNFATGQYANLHGLDIEIIEGDVTDWTTIQAAVKGCEVVFHQAALVSVPQSIHNPALNHATNVNGAFHVFEAARQAGVRRVVYATSSAVYGDLPGIPKRETDPLGPISPYGLAKQMNEQMAAMYGRTYGLEMVGLRYMNVYGPRQDPSSPYSGVLAIFCQAALRGEGVKIYGDGEQTRDFVYVADVVAANLLAAETTLSPEAPTPLFNIGRGQATSLNQIVAILAEVNGRALPVAYEAEREGDIKHSAADITRARQYLGYEPVVHLEEGLRHTMDWYKS